MQSNNSNSNNLLEVLNKYKETDMKVMKTNLKNACRDLVHEYGTRQDIAELVGMKLNHLQSCLNVSHSSILTFENLVKICSALNLDMNDIFKDTKIITATKKTNKFWTPEKKIDLLNRYSNGGVELVQKKFNLSYKTVMHYYNLFNKEYQKTN